VTLSGDDILIAVEAASRVTRAAVGRVVGTGPDAAHLDGVRVVAGPHQACGDCDVCRRAGATVCPNGRTLELAARVVARARWVLPMTAPLDVPGGEAALIGGEAALAYAMYARAGVAPREPTVVVGDGPVARLLAQVLVAKNAAPAPAAEHGARPAKIFACEGGIAEALAAAGPRATVAVALLDDTALDGAAVLSALGREVTLIGVRGAHPDLFPEIAALAVRGDLDLAAAGASLARY
jgi:threonine dehydrogenase-like Zn-dependent dehydrogenase